MKLLRTIKEREINQRATSALVVKYKQRNAARAVVFDNDGNIALLHASKKNFHKLPGGGIENQESMTEGLRRECLEEIGCEIKIGRVVGKVVEYRDKFALKQNSVCYIAEVWGEKGNPSYTGEEVRDGFKLLWLPIDDAIEMIRRDSPDDYEGKFIVVRDLIFLEKAKEVI